MDDSKDATRLVDLWSDSAGYRARFQPKDEIETMVNLLDLGTAANMVEIGCGNGTFAVAAAEAYADCKVWAFDALESALSACRTQSAHLPLSRFETGQAWAHSLPLADSSMDRILCRSVLHHIGNAAEVYREMARVLRRDGLLVLQTPCNFWDSSYTELLREVFHVLDDSHPRNYYRPGDVINGLNEAGIAMTAAQCWPFDFPYLTDAAADVIRRHKAESVLKLERVNPQTWTVELYWLRMTGIRLSSPFQ